MRTTWIRRGFLLLVAVAAAQACTLNPQPIPPGATGADAAAAPPLASTDPNAGVSDASSGGLKEGGNGGDAGTTPQFDGGDATADGDPDGGDAGEPDGGSDASDAAAD